MKEWKQAYRLAKFEIAVSMKSYFITCTFYIAMSWIFMLAFDLYLEGEFRFFDLMFLLIFIMFPTWMKRKEFQMRKMDGDLWTSPSIIMLQQLPIPKKIIIKSRFIIHAFYSFPVSVDTSHLDAAYVGEFPGYNDTSRVYRIFAALVVHIDCRRIYDGGK